MNRTEEITIERDELRGALLVMIRAFQSRDCGYWKIATTDAGKRAEKALQISNKEYSIPEEIIPT